MVLWADWLGWVLNVGSSIGCSQRLAGAGIIGKLTWAACRSSCLVLGQRWLAQLRADWASQSMWPLHMASLGFLTAWWSQVTEKSFLVAGFPQSELRGRKWSQLDLDLITDQSSHVPPTPLTQGEDAETPSLHTKRVK